MLGREDSARLSGGAADEGARGRLRVLVSAFACKPGGVSEDAVGWNVVRELGRRHDVWVITNAKDEGRIDAALRDEGDLSLTFRYVPTTRVGKLGTLGFNADYYLWQSRAYFAAKKLIADVRFDVAHHLTYARYWAPSFLSLLPVPFLFGPVGGGESVPVGLRAELDVGARRFEVVRSVARRLGELDPWVRRTARRSRVALAATPETAERLHALGAPDVRVHSPLGLSESTLEHVRRGQPPEAPFRAISVGRMLPWKGFDLGIRAFAQADLPDAELWLVGDGPHVPALEALANELGVADRVVFFGRLDRPETLERMASCHVLLHPSLHEAAGFVCLEAMAAGLPVVGLAAGGPGQLIELGGGVGVTTRSPDEARAEIAAALATYAADRDAYRRESAKARAYARTCTWTERVDAFEEFYGAMAGFR